MSEWQFSTPAVVARETTAWLFGPILGWLVHGPSVSGSEHLGEVEPPFLVCPNHTSHFDFSTMRLALGRRHRRRLVATAAADYWQTRRLRSFLSSWVGAMAFQRHAAGTESIKTIERLLGSGWNVLLFPEGTRSRTGEIAAFKPGIGLVAARTGRPVLPVHIVGLHGVLPPGARRPRRRHVEVRFGPPLMIGAGEDPRAFAARLEGVVREL